MDIGKSFLHILTGKEPQILDNEMNLFKYERCACTSFSMNGCHQQYMLFLKPFTNYLQRIFSQTIHTNFHIKRFSFPLIQKANKTETPATKILLNTCHKQQKTKSQKYYYCLTLMLKVKKTENFAIIAQLKLLNYEERVF